MIPSPTAHACSFSRLILPTCVFQFHIDFMQLSSSEAPTIIQCGLTEATMSISLPYHNQVHDITYGRSFATFLNFTGFDFLLFTDSTLVSTAAAPVYFQLSRHFPTSLSLCVLSPSLYREKGSPP